MKARELPPILFFLFLGAYVAWASRAMGLGTLYRPGAGLMSYYLGIALVLVSFGMILRMLFKRSAGAEKDGKSAEAIDYPKIAIVVAALVVYSLVIEDVGYIIATLFLLIILFHCAGSKRTTAVIASIITLLITYYGFTYLGLRFPPGILALIGL